MNFKKISTAVLASAMLAGCGASTAAPASTGSTQIDVLRIEFVPSKDTTVILSGTEGLDQLIIEAMDKRGYEIGSVEISVGADYDATGKALSEGTVDVGWLPSGEYVKVSDHTEVILTATRAGLSNDSTNPADWNGEENKTLQEGEEVKYYRALIIATPSEYGRKLAEKVNNGEALTWEDLDGAIWEVQKPSSSSGYIYPTMWLMENYDKKISDLSHVRTAEYGFASSFADAAQETCDIIVCYADGRNDYEEAWTLPTTKKDSTEKQGMGRTDSIWNELNVIGVTEGIYNDTVAVTKANPDIYNEAFISAMQDSLIEIIATEEGKAIFDVYSHTGYAKATDADYDGARKAQELIGN